MECGHTFSTMYTSPPTCKQQWKPRGERFTNQTTNHFLKLGTSSSFTHQKVRRNNRCIRVTIATANTFTTAAGWNRSHATTNAERIVALLFEMCNIIVAIVRKCITMYKSTIIHVNGCLKSKLFPSYWSYHWYIRRMEPRQVQKGAFRAPWAISQRTVSSFVIFTGW